MSGRPDIHHLDKPIVFVHIEKTAGTAFSNYIIDNIGLDAMHPLPYTGGTVSDYIGEGSKKFYYGHLEYAQCRLANIDAYYITFLRDPLSRALSHFRSWKNPENLSEFWLSRMSQSQADAIRQTQEMTFEEFVLTENYMIYGHFNNLMARRIAANPWGDPPYLWDAFDILSTEFTYFGIVDQFKQSTDLFEHCFEHAKPYAIPDKDANISLPYEARLNAKATQRLHDLNEHDFNLYNAAKELFGQRYRRMIEERDA